MENFEKTRQIATLEKGITTLNLMPWGRVGSNLVNSILEKSSLNLTIFNEPLTGIDTRGKNANQNNETRWNAQVDWLEQNMINRDLTRGLYINLSAIHIIKSAEFRKLMRPHIDNYIVQDRRDVVATVLSAMRTQAWVDEGAKLGEKRNWAIPSNQSISFRPRLSISQFKKFVTIVAKGRQVISTILQDQTSTTYYYEELVSDMDGVILDILHKSGAENFNYSIKSGKFGSDHLSDMILNHEVFSNYIIENKIPTILELS